MKTEVDSAGFTLVELMITVLLSLLIVAAVFSAYTVNERVHGVQKQVVDLQQNMRAAVDMLVREIKSAGFDPTDSAGAGITGAFPDAIAFSVDRNGDGDVADADEHIAFSTFASATGGALGRAAANAAIVLNPNGVNHWEAVGQQTAAENIEGLEFSYLLADGSSTTLPDVSDYKNIVAVDISVVARANIPDQAYNNTSVYTSASGNNFTLAGANPPNDNFRRMLLVQHIQLRNMGL